MENVSDVPGWLVTTNYSGKVGLTVKLYVDPTRVGQFQELAGKHLATTLAEPGVIRFSVNRDPTEESGVFWLRSGSLPCSLISPHPGLEIAI